MEKKVMDAVISNYLESHDFNGISMHDLRSFASENELKNIIEDLINREKITLVKDLNPHIKRFPDLPINKQLEILKENKGIICVYPHKKVLTEFVDKDEYQNEPFKRELLLGSAQLEPIFFELSVLDNYFNDPRYLVLNSDYNGSISIKDEFYESIPEKDRINLQTFGLGYNENGDRVIVVFLRYLSDLSPEHQQIWNTYKLSEKCLMDPDYFKNDILGEWTETVSIFNALCEEFFQINEMCKLMGKPPLFKENFREKRPDDFKIFLKPTLKNYNDFVLVLDKMISENINKDFFRGDIELTEDQTRRDGKIVVIQKGTIRLFEEWLRSKFKTDDEFFEKIFGPIKLVRKERQDPAHRIDENVYNKKFHDDQDELILKMYIAIRNIRLAFANHPSVRGHKVPEWLYEGRIRRYVKDEFKTFDNVVNNN
ncbi:AAA family ATPase [Methanobacterium formicicum]|uniref:Uncharacterized protein n=1 Tax=Methanobacterium formicicum TaxID=2162 RepID=A0A0S4FM00_METFO|nr:AAA family ATPase [Methanobacterium formicicum]CEL24002.1 hypothetical protein MB9_0354 [Methanobacterium formicicum]